MKKVSEAKSPRDHVVETLVKIRLERRGSTIPHGRGLEKRNRRRPSCGKIGLIRLERARGHGST
jgi:hypothetical protein